VAQGVDTCLLNPSTTKRKEKKGREEERKGERERKKGRKNRRKEKKTP
jgi:hypothetical protein